MPLTSHILLPSALTLPRPSNSFVARSKAAVSPLADFKESVGTLAMISFRASCLFLALKVGSSGASWEACCLNTSELNRDVACRTAASVAFFCFKD